MAGQQSHYCFGQAGPGWRGQLAAVLLALACGFAMQVPHLLFSRAFVNLDFTMHYNYAREAAASLKAGDFWPHYAFLAHRGLGEPGLLYYSPLYYLATALVAMLTGNVWAAMQWVEILSSAALGYFAWRLAAEWCGWKTALASIPLAVLSPMVCLLQLSFNGFPWACALAPLAALTWAVLRPGASGRWLNLPAIVALSLTVFTHTVSGLMALILLGGVSLAALLQQRMAALRGPALWGPAVTAIMGLLLSSAYLLPAYGSQDLIDAAVWRQNFTPFNAFSLSIVTAWLFGVRWFAFQWPVSLVTFLLVGSALWTLRRTMRSDPAAGRFLVTATTVAAVVLFLATELSYPLWLVDTPLRNIQFPHRLISILVPLTAALVPIALARGRGRMAKASIVLLAMANVGMGGLVVAKGAMRDGAVVDVGESRFLPYPGLDEYRTAEAARRPTSAVPYDFMQDCTVRDVQCSPGLRTGRGMAWRVVGRAPTMLRLPVYCFPAWGLTVNGIPAEARCDSQRALVEVQVPRGNSEVRLQWRMRPIERFGMALTAAGAALLVLLVILRRRRTKVPAVSPPPPLPR